MPRHLIGTMPTMAVHEQGDDDADLNDLEQLLHRNEESVARIRAMIQELKKRIDAEKSSGGGAASERG